jgi:carbonic anhydrase
MSYFPENLTDRYRRFKHRNFAPNQDHYEQLAADGQSPQVMMVSCCDSRVDPGDAGRTVRCAERRQPGAAV